jgi:hypothetical protein
MGNLTIVATTYRVGGYIAIHRFAISRRAPWRGGMTSICRFQFHNACGHPATQKERGGAGATVKVSTSIKNDGQRLKKSGALCAPVADAVPIYKK